MNSAEDVLKLVLKLNPEIDSFRFVAYEEKATWRESAREVADLRAFLVQSGLMQDSGERTFKTLTGGEIASGYMSKFAESSISRLISVTSKVTLNSGKCSHIPMMDFVCDPSNENLMTLVSLFVKLDYGRGFLLNSGKSFHYYGTRLLVEEEWRVFLGECLLMTGFSDDRYIGHQLVDGYCALRVTARKGNPLAPFVVAQIPG